MITDRQWRRVSRIRRREWRKTYRWPKGIRAVNKRAPRTARGRLQPDRDWERVVCRRHGILHYWSQGCPRCSRKHFKLTNTAALAAKRKKRDKRAPALRK